MLMIRPYEMTDEKAWVYTKALSYLFSPFFDDRETHKSDLDQTVFEDRIALVAEQDGVLVGLLDIDIYNAEYSRSYRYAPADKVAYFTNLAVHPDYQGQGIAQALYAQAEQDLRAKGVAKLAIFTREGDKVNYLYQKWGGQLVCQDTLIIGRPKTSVMPSFEVDLSQGRICLSNADGQSVPYYLREGVYIVSNPEDMSLFDIDECFQEMTYVVDLTTM